MDARVKPAHDTVGMNHWVYILASGPGGTLYVGMTNNLIRRVYEHREGFVRGFTRRYGVKQLVYFEATIPRSGRSNARKTSSTGRVSGRSI
jgi:predicted GIY-YIG superfamily endonuclease